MCQPRWEGSFGQKRCMYMYGWVPLLSTWNYHNILNQLLQYKIKNEKFYFAIFLPCHIFMQPSIKLSYFWCTSNWVTWHPIFKDFNSLLESGKNILKSTLSPCYLKYVPWPPVALASPETLLEMRTLRTVSRSTEPHHLHFTKIQVICVYSKCWKGLIRMTLMNNKGWEVLKSSFITCFFHLATLWSQFESWGF